MRDALLFGLLGDSALSLTPAAFAVHHTFSVAGFSIGGLISHRNSSSVSDATSKLTCLFSLHSSKRNEEDRALTGSQTLMPWQRSADAAIRVVFERS